MPAHEKDRGIPVNLAQRYQKRPMVRCDFSRRKSLHVQRAPAAEIEDIFGTTNGSAGGSTDGRVMWAPPRSSQVAL